MKTAKAITTMFSIGCMALHVHAQGGLAPPGAPVPTMKTLQQVEPRMIITSLPYSINAPGSYYLTTNLVGVAGKAGITINASDVTVDLNGFALAGVPGSFAGILISGSRNNIEVRNGTIRDWIRSGVDAANAGSSIFSDLRVYSNGWAGLFDPAGYGLRIGDGSLVQGCVASANNLGGIYIGSGGTVSGCTAQNNAGVGITTGTGGTIGGCTARAIPAAESRPVPEAPLTVAPPRAMSATGSVPAPAIRWADARRKTIPATGSTPGIIARWWGVLPR